VIRFCVLEEFLDELEKDADQVERGIVRLTNRYRPRQDISAVRFLSVVATARVGQDILRLEVPCGQLFGIDPHDKEAVEKAEAIRGIIRRTCERLGLEVRAGVLEENAK